MVDLGDVIGNTLGALPVVGGLFDQQDAEPVYPNRPKALSAVLRKYDENDFSMFDPGTVQSMQEWDLQRANRGAMPLSVRDSLVGMTSVQRGEPIVPAPERRPQNFLSNALGDIKGIVTSIPRLPYAMWQEAQNVLQFPNKLAEIHERPGGNFLSDILEAPGIRMVPGSYVGANLAKGDINELITHPIYSLLDVLPYGKYTGVDDLIKGTSAYSATRGYIKDWMQRSQLGRIAYQLSDVTGRRELRRFSAAEIPLNDIMNDPVRAATEYAHVSGLKDILPIEIKHREIMERPEFKAIKDDAQRMNDITEKAVQGRWSELSPVEKEFVAEMEGLNTMTSYVIQRATGDLVIVPNNMVDRQNAMLTRNPPHVAGVRNPFETYYNAQSGYYSIRNNLDPEQIYRIARDSFLQNNAMPAWEVYNAAQAKKIAQIQQTYMKSRLYRSSLELNEKIVQTYDTQGRPLKVVHERIHPDIPAVKAAWGMIRDYADDFSQTVAASGRSLPSQMIETFKGYLLAAQSAGADISDFLVKNQPRWRNDMLTAGHIDKFINSLDEANLHPSSVWNSYDQVKSHLTDYADLKWGRVALDKIEHLEKYLDQTGVDTLYKEAIESIRTLRDRSKTADKGILNDIIQSIQYRRMYSEWRATNEFKQGLKFDSPVKLEQMQKMVSKQLPARYTDYLDDQLRRKVYDSYEFIQKQTNAFTPEEWAKVSEASLMGAWESLSALDSIFRQRGIKTGMGELIGDEHPWQMRDPTKSVSPDGYTISAQRIKDSYRSELQETLDTIRRKGDPVAFVHHVTQRSVEGMNMRKLLEFKPKPSQIKARVMDVSPWVHDMQVAMQHRTFELVFQAYYDEMFRQLVDPNGNLAQHVLDRQQEFGLSYGSIPDEFDSPIARTYNQLTRQLEPQFRRLWDNGRVDPTTSYRDGLKRYVEERYEKWDPESMITFQSTKWNPKKKTVIENVNGKPVVVSMPDIYIPKAFAKALRDLGNQPMTSKVWDPIMNAFRYAVLPFSPRFHINNILGGAMMLMLDQGPVTLANLADARQLLKEGFLEDPRTGARINLTPEVRASMGQQQMFVKEFQTLRGQGVATALADKLGFSPEAIRSMAGNTDALREAFNKAVDFSFKFNQVTDDLYRATAYITEHKRLVKQLVKDGKTLDEAYEIAGKEAVGAVRRVLHTWDSMAPFERTVIRNVIPFYGFLSHITKFAIKFPYDHPFRAAVMAGLTRAELDDMSLVPDKFLGMIPLPFGGSDQEEAFLNMTGANPFSDVADMFTLEGFAGTINPLITTLGEQLGIDFMTGGPSQDPLTGYDPYTGRPDWKPTSILSNLLSNTIPQTNVPLAIAGANPEYNAIASSDPEAAQRYLLSSVGIPSMYRTFDMTQEALKEQYYRKQVMNTTLNQALQSGKYRVAEQQYPQFAPIFSAVQELQATQPQQATVPDLVSAQESLKSAITGNRGGLEGGPQDLEEARQVLARAAS